MMINAKIMAGKNAMPNMARPLRLQWFNNAESPVAKPMIAHNRANKYSRNTAAPIGAKHRATKIIEHAVNEPETIDSALPPPQREPADLK
ncbi:hypothetical protein CJD36_009585 [Flavipsychrobacter stenotrophus]|uniref:Uncharacterized protein n=1 Tax=Flavipsychrobacter stenotrophus TaxID=2077091 RepID=A0A2S7SYM3_9BACT|nr:hypothetical protein CJD36_009585 [Flavipsychrobacter stenotrophus]